MFYVDVKHDGLKKFRRFSGADKYVVEQRARAQAEAWDELWQRRVKLEQQHQAQQQKEFAFKTKKANAARMTIEAQKAIASLSSILKTGIESNHFQLKTLYDKGVFMEPKPRAPAEQPPPREPSWDDASFNIAKDLWSQLVPSVMRKREQAAHLKYVMARSEWLKIKELVAQQNGVAKTLYEECFVQYEARAREFIAQKLKHNAEIDAFQAQYHNKQPEAVIEYVDSVLSYSDYPDFFPKQWEAGFTSETSALIVDYELPSVDEFPTLKAVKYVQSRDAIEQSFLRESDVAKLYDAAIYQTCLRTLHELFATDDADVLMSVTLNGWVNFTDRSTGKRARTCIISVHTKDAFQQINLEAVDPKVCFRSLNGVARTKLSDTKAVLPILRLKQTDDQLVSAQEAIDTTS